MLLSRSDIELIRERPLSSASGQQKFLTLKKSVKTAKDKDIPIFDLAQDYGFGKAQRMIGEFGTDDIVLSSKFTPFTSYKLGQVRKSLLRDLDEFKRTYVDIYWLH